MKWKSVIAQTAVILGMAGWSLNAAAEAVQIKGSDTLVHLSSAWAEKFMAANPDIEVAVTGGGSGTGIASLLNGTADLANASRPIKDSEQKMAKAKGFEAIEHTVALDGIAVIVNPSNPVKVLAMNQIKKIYTGQITNWKAVGGSNAKIVLYTRDSSSGTFAFFQEHVLEKKDYSVKARRLASNSAIVQGVAEDMNSIGYVGLGYLVEAGNTVRALQVKKNETSPAIGPANATVKDGTYPISRGLYVYSHGRPQGAAKTFVDYMLSTEGQKTVEEMGFVKVQ
ncbi:PstS family phosphate ABC transporter substrate-binding protein [candidate division FCPU426 bacterium]|nr:PstS family phosphate ABC transporter substrate-binding protein [candidate division FCPU426 bacterium]